MQEVKQQVNEEKNALGPLEGETAEADGQSSFLPNNYERLLDLVRYCRHQLHDEGLITDGEFASLVIVGSESARRLEGYDFLRAEIKRLTEERNQLAVINGTLHEAVRIAGLRLAELNEPGSPLGEIRDDLYAAFRLGERQPAASASALSQTVK